MKSMAQRNSGRSLTVAAVICSWLALSNHCAVAALAARGTGQPALDHRQDAEAIDCPFHSSWTRDDANFPGSDLCFEEFAFSALSRNTPAPLLLDTGPPDALSFAELILQRSLLAHAPPILV
jgi:hypothetical protein